MDGCRAVVHINSIRRKTAQIIYYQDYAISSTNNVGNKHKLQDKLKGDLPTRSFLRFRGQF